MQPTSKSRPYLAAVQLPYSWLTGNPGLEPTGRMSGFRRAANCPAVQVKAPDASEVFSKRNCGTVCRLGVGTTKSWATTYTLYSVLGVIPHDPALPQSWLKPQTGSDCQAGGLCCNSLQHSVSFAPCLWAPVRWQREQQVSWLQAKPSIGVGTNVTCCLSLVPKQAKEQWWLQALQALQVKLHSSAARQSSKHLKRRGCQPE